MTDRSDAGRVTIRYADGRGARLELEPGSDHPEGRFTVTESILTKGGEWKPTGTDDARAVNVERPGDETFLQVRRHLRAIVDGEDAEDAEFHARNALQHLDHTEAWL